MPGEVIVGYVDTPRGHDALALGRILAKARGAEMRTVTAADGEELASVARERGADLVVIGSTHRGPLGRIVPGTTIGQVLGEAGCAVAVAPPDFAKRGDGATVWQPLDGQGEDVGMRVIGVGFDGTPESRAALELATELAVRNGAALRVYSVARRNAGIAPDAPMTPTPLSTELERRRAELHKIVAALPEEVRAQPVVLRGFPADELLAASRLGVDLLVVGTHVGGHLHRLLHKSTAGLIVGHARCPILVCPTPVAASVGAPA